MESRVSITLELLHSGMETHSCFQAADTLDMQPLLLSSHFWSAANSD